MVSNVVRDASGAITGYYGAGGQFVDIATVRQQSAQPQQQAPLPVIQQQQTQNPTLTPVTFSHDAQGNVVTKEATQLPKPFVSSVPSTPIRSAEQAEAAMNRGDIPKPFTSASQSRANVDAGQIVNGDVVKRPFVSTALPKPYVSQTPAGDLGLPKPYVAPPGQTTIEKPTGEIAGVKVPVVSDAIAFFQPTKVTTVREATVVTPEVTRLKTQASSTDLAGNVVTTKTYETTGGKTTIRTGGTVETPSGFDTFQQNLSKQAYSGYGSLFGVSGEQTKRALGVSTKIQSDISSKASTPLNLAVSTGGAQLKESLDKPVETAANVGIGVAFGGGTKAVEGLVGIGRAATAEKVISQGGLWRSADVFSGGVIKYAPKVLAGVYAVDVGSRATEGGTDISTRSIERVGVIASSETLPMLAGGIIGYKTPGVILKSARLSDIGYKSALQEGGATGRFDYYIKQPVKSTVEIAKTPITRAKLEIPQFIEEAGGSQVKGIGEYAKYKVGTAYRANVDIPIKSAIQSFGESAKSLPTTMLKPFVEARVTGVPTAQAKLGQASIEVARWRYGETPGVTERIYGKYFDIKTSLPVKAEKGLVSGETALWGFGQKAKTPGVTLKSVWQEKGYSLTIEPGGFPSIKGRSKITNPFVWEVPQTSGGTSGSTASATIRKDFGGGAGQRSPSRITSRVIGGKTVRGLSAEPSLKSIGKPQAVERTSTSQFGKTTIDFRGNPASATMKPMDLSKTSVKQASGVSLLTESLPKVEGMPTSRVVSQQRAPAFPYQYQRSVQIVAEPESRIKQEQITEVIPALEFGRRTTTISGISEASRARSSEIADLSARDIFTVRLQRQSAEPISSRGVRSVVDIKPIRETSSTQRTTQRQERIVTQVPRIDTGTRYDIDQIRIITPTRDTMFRQEAIPRTTITPVPITRVFGDVFQGGRGIPPTFHGFFSGGSTGSPNLSKRFGKYRETIRLRSMLW